MGGKMRTAKVIGLPYDRAWKAAFEAIKGEIESAVGGLMIGIEHVCGHDQPQPGDGPVRIRRGVAL